MLFKLYFCSCTGDRFVIKYKGINLEVTGSRVTLEANSEDDLYRGLAETDPKILSNLNKVSAL